MNENFGKWKVKDGAFKRATSSFRNWISNQPNAKFKAEIDRYHLYISYACPWAHRVMIYRKLKGLESILPFSVVHPIMPAESWLFAGENNPYPEATVDHLYGYQYAYELYQKADPNYDGLVTVPILWDKKEATIVNNESSEIIRMLNTEFNHLTNNYLDFYPKDLRQEIDQVNEYIYHSINNGVYKCGFATTQAAYNQAYQELFTALDWLEDRLKDKNYLVGEQITEADWRLFVTLIRFDAVYYSHFKTNKKRIIDYPNIHKYIKSLYEHEGIKETVNFDHIKTHYFASHKSINPTGIIPQGPDNFI